MFPQQWPLEIPHPIASVGWALLSLLHQAIWTSSLAESEMFGCVALHCFVSFQYTKGTKLTNQSYQWNQGLYENNFFESTQIRSKLSKTKNKKPWTKPKPPSRIRNDEASPTRKMCVFQRCLVKNKPVLEWCHIFVLLQLQAHIKSKIYWKLDLHNLWTGPRRCFL